MNGIIMNRLDYLRIRKQVDQAWQAGRIKPSEAESLLQELESAKIVEPREIPPDVVTMNSVVKISFPSTGQQATFRIVYPDQACLKENKISIFSPVATALIGYKKGDEIEWIVPAGLTRIRIEEILYQPESSGDFTL